MTVEDLQKRLAFNIKRIRKQRGLTQEALAARIGLAAISVNGIEGCRRWPRAESLVLMANALNVDVAEFFSPADGVSAASAAAFCLSDSKTLRDFRRDLDKLWKKYCVAKA